MNMSVFNLFCVCTCVCVWWEGGGCLCACSGAYSESSIFMKGESVKAGKFMDFTCLFYEGLSGGPGDK